MTELVDPSSALYVIVEARRSEGPPERFVLAYCDEESLRDLIAAPSIVGLGFSTREEALANAEWCAPVTSSSKQALKPSLERAEKWQRGFKSTKRRLLDAFRVAETQRIACRALQHAVAMAFLVFYSKNIASTAIRKIIGAS